MTAENLRWNASAVVAVLAAQACAALADSALLIVAIELLEARQSPEWATPALRVGFYACYVVLAPLAGRWADRWPKGRLMTVVNAVKLAGVVALALGAHPLLIFAAIGCAAAAYAPARYGVLPELTRGPELLRANAAMEIVTILALIGGFLLGSFLVAGVGTGVSCAVLGALYAAGAVSTLRPRGAAAPLGRRVSFVSGVKVLLRDSRARNALVLTSIFWSAAAVLQFLMIDWARRDLGLSLTHAASLPALFAIGMVAGAAGAGVWPVLNGPRAAALCGVALGGAILLMPLARSLLAACALLTASGALAGFLLVPMNAALQQRGASLMQPGLSVAVQNFFENGLSVFFLAAYGAALVSGVSADSTLYGLGFGVILLVGLGALRSRIPVTAHTRTTP